MQNFCDHYGTPSGLSDRTKDRALQSGLEINAPTIAIDRQRKDHGQEEWWLPEGRKRKRLEMHQYKGLSTLCGAYSHSGRWTSFPKPRILVCISAPSSRLPSVEGVGGGRFYSQHRQYSRIARALSARPGGATEVYVSYGMTQKLFEACSSQADYRIPQAAQKGAEVPKTAWGEDLGVGGGWWCEGSYITCNV